MSRTGWRLRLFLQRAIPHTPAKRVGYGAALLAALGVGIVGGAGAAIVVVALIAGVRWWGVRRATAHRGLAPTTRAYFFEGTESDDPSR